MYFSSLFPYVVLFCFLVRGLMLKGSVDGIAHMFTPKVRVRAASSCAEQHSIINLQSDLLSPSLSQLEKMLEPQVWREAATQVFFALGLGFGGVIAFSSYNKIDNNCHFDAVLVSVINFLHPILLTFYTLLQLALR